MTPRPILRQVGGDASTPCPVLASRWLPTHRSVTCSSCFGVVDNRLFECRGDEYDENDSAEEIPTTYEVYINKEPLNNNRNNSNPNADVAGKDGEANFMGGHERPVERPKRIPSQRTPLL